MDFEKMRNIIFFVGLAIISIFFLYIIKPIFYPIFWAAVIASIFHPLYEKLKKKLKFGNLTTTIILLMVVLIIIVPLILISTLLIKESIDIYGEIGNKGGQISAGAQTVFNWIKHNPVTNRFNIDESFWVEKISETTSAITSFIFATVRGVTENSVMFLFMFVVMLYALFYFIRDGAKFLKKAMYLCPLGDKYELLFYKKFTSAARAAIKGTLLIGLAQGALGALLFYVVGIKGALIWGLMMTAFSILIGPYFIWVPAGIIMLLLGNIWQGLVIFGFGITIISTIDNVLKPMLIGRDTQIHPLFIFLSTLGGALVFGISGFIIGPVITALLMAFWEMYEHYYKNDLANDK